ncbi:MAG: carbohydrate binding family 9 domain-containing protein [Gammaproteobacteria bacterium]|nr:carbohydrate binding family 9 domain-containing protein [Gammaproteobacteria bacterium]
MSGRMRNFGLIFLCGLALAAALAAAEQSTFSPKSVVVPQISGRIELDGRLDEAEWQDAVKITDFQQFSPGNGEPPSEPTEFLLALDADNLYVAVRFTDSDPAGIKRSQLVQGQGVFNDDYAQILLDTFNDRRTGYIFYINANGVQRDGLLLGGVSYNMDWDGIRQAASTVNDSGWQAEIAIPFKTLSFDRNADTWGINLIRSIRRKREEVAWSQRDRRITLDVSGELRGMPGREQGRGLDLVPSAAISERENFIGNSSSRLAKPSLDAFWRITPSLVGALTLNTDFSATDVDDRQVNLTRFSLFFPEKRDFFLEDSEIFEFGGLTQNGRPFFRAPLAFRQADSRLISRRGPDSPARSGGILWEYSPYARNWQPVSPSRMSSWLAVIAVSASSRRSAASLPPAIRLASATTRCTASISHCAISVVSAASSRRVPGYSSPPRPAARVTKAPGAHRSPGRTIVSRRCCLTARLAETSARRSDLPIEPVSPNFWVATAIDTDSRKADCCAAGVMASRPLRSGTTRVDSSHAAS